MSNPTGFTGHLPYSDENSQRIDSAEHGQSGVFGWKYVSLIDQSGAEVFPSTSKPAIIQVSSSGNNQIVAAVASKKIRVLQVRLMASGTVNVKWRSASTDIDGLAYLIANTGYVLPFSSLGWFETVAGEALNLNLSDAIAVGGVIKYVEI